MGEQPSILSICECPSLAPGKGLLAPTEEYSVLSFGEVVLASGKRPSVGARGPLVTLGGISPASISGYSLPRFPSVHSVGGFVFPSPSDVNGVSGAVS